MEWHTHVKNQVGQECVIVGWRVDCWERQSAMGPECPCVFLLGMPWMQSLDHSLQGPFLQVVSWAGVMSPLAVTYYTNNVSPKLSVSSNATHCMPRHPSQALRVTSVGLVRHGEQHKGTRSSEYATFALSNKALRLSLRNVMSSASIYKTGTG